MTPEFCPPGFYEVSFQGKETGTRSSSGLGRFHRLESLCSTGVLTPLLANERYETHVGQPLQAVDRVGRPGFVWSEFMVRRRSQLPSAPEKNK